jgi:hypothetical protein
MKTLHVAVALTLAALSLVPGVAVGAAALHVNRTDIHFGGVSLAIEAGPHSVFVANTGNAPLTLTALTLGGARPSVFRLAGECVSGSILQPGARCRVDLYVTETVGDPTRARLDITSDGTPGTASVELYAQSKSYDAYRPPGVTPRFVDFGPQVVGASSSTQQIVFRNSATDVFPITTVQLRGPQSGDFSLTHDCGNRTLAAGASCTLTVGFSPTAAGPRSAEIQLISTFYSEHSILVMGNGTLAPGALVTVVEFHNETLDHYFISSLAADIEALDTGRFAGWVRTGQTFKAYDGPVANAEPVCRFYLPPAFGDSHFYGRSVAECDQTRAKFPQLVFESPAVMYLFLPATGTCGAGTVPVYRAFSNRGDANHRYTILRTLRDEMVGRGWVAEGDGPDLVVMCAPA